MAKKSAPKVDSTPVAVQSVKKGKRGTQQTINKVVSAKKQKIVKDETLQKVVYKNLPEKVEISPSEHDSPEPEVEPKAATISAPADVPQELVNNLTDDGDSEEEVEEIDNMASAIANGDTIVNEESNDDENSEDDSEEEIETLATEQASSDGSDADEASEDEAEDEQPAETPKKKNSDAKMLDADSGKKANKTRATPQTGKTLFVGNLAFRIEEDDVRDFFKTSGEVVEVRFATDHDGKFKGFGHVEFATPEDAQKALALNGQELLERSVKLDLARERSEKREEGSFQKGGRSQGGGTTASATAFIKGFDTSLGEDEVRSALQEHFGSCGSITRLSIPPNPDTGGVKGMAYIDFAEPDGFSKAMELDGTDLGGGFNLTVIEAKPRGDSGGGRGGGFSRGRGGRGRSGGRFGGRGDSGGRRGGGRRGSRGGRSSRF